MKMKYRAIYYSPRESFKKLTEVIKPERRAFSSKNENSDAIINIQDGELWELNGKTPVKPKKFTTINLKLTPFNPQSEPTTIEKSKRKYSSYSSSEDLLPSPIYKNNVS